MEFPIITRIKNEFKGPQDGCTDQEITDLMELQGVTCLPEVYRQLLLLTGQALDDFFMGRLASAWALMEGLKQGFLEEVIGPTELILPDDIFVFLTSHGVAWLFFRTKGCQDDPIVYEFIEEERAFRKLANSISEYLTRVLDRTSTKENALPPQYVLYDAELGEFYPVDQE